MKSQSLCSILLFAAFSADCIEGFGSGRSSQINSFQTYKGSFRRKIIQTTDGITGYIDASVSDDVDSAIDPANRFHTDMRRVLESRKNAFSDPSNGPSIHSLSPMDRRNRPALLSQDIDGANRVTSMLRHMVNIGIANEETYQIVLEALCRRGRLRWIDGDSSVVCSADVVDGLIDEVWMRQKGDLSTHTCNLALQVYAACSTPRGERRYAEKAQTLLYTMENNGINPSIESFSHLVNAWAWQQENLGDGECARMAESNLKRLIENAPDDETKLQGYDWVLEAWSKSQDDDAPVHADRILNKMKLIKKTNNSLASTLPNSQSYTNAILAWTKSNSTSKAHDLLCEYVKNFEDKNSSGDQGPELFAFNSVISAWARVGRTDMAEELLAKANDIRMKYKTLVPDIFTYNSIIHGYLKDKNSTNGLKKMLKLVDYMEKNKVQQPSISPDCFTYHCLLRAWGKSDDVIAAENSVQTLKKMHDFWESGDTSLKPATAFYNMAINKIAKSKGTVNPHQALEVLNLIELSQVCNPDIISYTTVIECFSKSSDPAAAERSLDLFYEAWEIYREREDPVMMPNLRTYTMVILSLSKAPTLENIIKARDLLSQLNELYSKNKDSQLLPNAYPYNYLLNSAACCVGDAGDKLKAFQIAAQTYNDIRTSDHISPDSYTYAFWFKLCNHLLPEGALRRKSIAYSFEQCKKDGMFSQAVLERLLLGTPKDILQDILDLKPDVSSAAYKKMKLRDFPPSWSRNIR